jgi:2-dehydropantoate 2-reductase
MRIMVMGAGAVGGYFGARLVLAGKDVVFVARGAMLEALRNHGVRIQGISSFSLPSVQAFGSAREAGVCDLILVSVKCWDTRQAAREIFPCVGENTSVLSLQNGIENEEILAEVLGESRVLGGVSRVGVEMLTPGVIEHTHGGEITLGQMDGQRAERAEAVATLFIEAGIPARVTDQFKAELWEKCAWNSSINGISAITRTCPGEIVTHGPTRELARSMVLEAAQVAEAAGVLFNRSRIEPTLDFIEKVLARSRTSTLQDIEKGKRIEYDGLNGAILRAAEKHGIAVPLNRVVWALLSLIDPARIKG